MKSSKNAIYVDYTPMFYADIIRHVAALLNPASTRQMATSGVPLRHVATLLNAASTRQMATRGVPLRHVAALLNPASTRQMATSGVPFSYESMIILYKHDQISVTSSKLCASIKKSTIVQLCDAVLSDALLFYVYVYRKSSSLRLFSFRKCVKYLSKTNTIFHIRSEQLRNHW